MGDKVAILGTVPNSRCMAPYDDPTWDIWCCSAGNSQQAAPPRVTEWHELHSLVDLHAPENKPWYPNYIAWMNTQTFPVWMQEKNNDIPRAQVFPRRELMERFGPSREKGLANWFTSTPAWMFAHAIVRGYQTIGIFGVDMAAAEEHYTGQKAGLLRWFEIGRGLGINVVVPLESSLAFDYPVYGYAESSRLGRHLLVRENELKAQIQALQQQEAQIRGRIFSLSGSLEQVTFDRRTFVSGHTDAEITEEEMQYTAQVAAAPNAADEFKPPASSAPIVAASSHAPTAADFGDNPDAALLVRKKRTNGPLHRTDDIG